MAGSGDEKMLTGEHDGGDMLIGKNRKRKMISANGKAPVAKKKSKHSKRKAHHKKTTKK